MASLYLRVYDYVMTKLHVGFRMAWKLSTFDDFEGPYARIEYWFSLPLLPRRCVTMIGRRRCCRHGDASCCLATWRHRAESSWGCTGWWTGVRPDMYVWRHATSTPAPNTPTHTVSIRPRLPTCSSLSCSQKQWCSQKCELGALPPFPFFLFLRFLSLLFLSSPFLFFRCSFYFSHSPFPLSFLITSEFQIRVLREHFERPSRRGLELSPSQNWIWCNHRV